MENLIKSITRITGCNECNNTGVNLKSYPNYVFDIDSLPNLNDDQIKLLIDEKLISDWTPDKFTILDKYRIRNSYYKDKCPTCNGKTIFEVTLINGSKFNVESLDEILVIINQKLRAELDKLYRTI